MRRLPGLVLVVMASSALAVKPGDALVVIEATHLLKEPKAGAKVVAPLAAGEEVRWLGPSEKDRLFHLVEAKGQRGFVAHTSLRPRHPTPAAPTHTFTPPKYAEPRPDDPLGFLEELNRNAATPAALEQHRRALGR